MLLRSFEERKPLFEKHLAAASKDAASLLFGPLARLTGAEDTLKRLWSLTNAFNTIQGSPKSPWETAKAMKTVGFTVVGEFTRLLAGDNPFRQAWTPLSILVNTCQTVIDLGSASGDAAVLYALAGQAKDAQREYGETIAFYTANAKQIDAMAASLGKLSEAARHLDGRLEDARATIAGAGATSADFYYPFT